MSYLTDLTSVRRSRVHMDFAFRIVADTEQIVDSRPFVPETMEGGIYRRRRYGKRPYTATIALAFARL